jgi:hypothetical protein
VSTTPAKVTRSGFLLQHVPIGRELDGHRVVRVVAGDQRQVTVAHRELPLVLGVTVLTV